MTPLVVTFTITGIRQLNDAFRADLTEAPMAIEETVIQVLGRLGVASVVRALQALDTFDPEDQLHDEGAFMVAGVPVHWEIVYATPDLSAPSDHPADPTRSRRLLVLQLIDLPPRKGGRTGGKAPRKTAT